MSDIVRKDVPRTFLGTLLKAHANKMGLRVDTEDGEDGGTEYIRHDVIGSRDGEDWLCFSVVLVPSDHSVGIWTREMMDKSQGPLEVERTYSFSSDTFENWLECWFENTVLEELTRP